MISKNKKKSKRMQNAISSLKKKNVDDLLRLSDDDDDQDLIDALESVNSQKILKQKSSDELEEIKSYNTRSSKKKQ